MKSRLPWLPRFVMPWHSMFPQELACKDLSNFPPHDLQPSVTSSAHTPRHLVNIAPLHSFGRVPSSDAYLSLTFLNLHIQWQHLNIKSPNGKLLPRRQRRAASLSRPFSQPSADLPSQSIRPKKKQALSRYTKRVRILHHTSADSLIIYRPGWRAWAAVAKRYSVVLQRFYF